MDVTPTRMELAKLKKRLKASKEGHKLLKEKQDALMRAFILSLNDAARLRKEINHSMRRFSMEAGLSVAGAPHQMVKNAFLVPDTLVYANITQEKWMGVSLLSLTYDMQKAKMPSALVSNPQMAKIAKDMQGLLPQLLLLGVAEKNCGLLSAEIEMLRRRVNALEHRVIPGMETNIRTIEMKLSDNERETITRLIKIKNMK